MSPLPPSSPKKPQNHHPHRPSKKLILGSQFALIFKLVLLLGTGKRTLAGFGEDGVYGLGFLGNAFKPVHRR